MKIVSLKKALMHLLILLILAVTVSAIEITKFDADFSIDGKDTRTIYTIKFTSESPENFSLEIPADSQINSVALDDLFVDALEQEQETKKILMFPINSSGKVIIDFTTDSYVDAGRKSYFVADIKPGYAVNQLYSRVSLPQSSFLQGSKEEGGSVFPAGEIKTDGKIIYIEWNVAQVSESNSFPMFVIYKTVDKSYWILYFGAFIILGAAVYLGFNYLFKRRAEHEPTVKDGNDRKDDAAAQTASSKMVKETKNKDEEIRRILSHLTEDEQQIVNILADREGHIEQGTLVIITGFSKAHLSRLLEELQRRRIVHKEKKGKKNIVWLKSNF